MSAKTEQKNTNENNSSNDEKSGETANNSGGKTQDKPVFSAGETALFVDGKRVGTLSKEETFAYNAVKKQLRLATYTVENDGGRYSLTVRRNSPKIKFKLLKNGQMLVNIKVVMTAGLLDCSNALTLENGKDAGDIPTPVFKTAEEKLNQQITALFEKCRAVGCDIFGVQSALQKHEKKSYESLKETILQNAVLEVTTRFQGVR